MRDTDEFRNASTEAQRVMLEARKREAARDAARVPVDYDALNKMVRRQRAALTRAINSGDKDKLVLVVRDAVREWRKPGAMWPDDWSRWQRALDDNLPWGTSPQIDDL